MNKEIKDKWVKALRSGEYIQGLGALKQIINGVERYCCLGVLCDLYRKEQMVETIYWKKFEDINSSTYMFYDADSEESRNSTMNEDINSGILTKNVRKWAGLTYNNPIIPSIQITNDKRLASINDTGASFNEIADLIEENYFKM